MIVVEGLRKIIKITRYILAYKQEVINSNLTKTMEIKVSLTVELPGAIM